MSGALRRRLDRLVAADEADGTGLAGTLEALCGQPPAAEPPEALAARIAQLEPLDATMRAPPSVLAGLLGMLRNQARSAAPSAATQDVVPDEGFEPL